MSLFLHLLVFAFTFSPCFAEDEGEAVRAARSAAGVLKDAAPLGLPDIWDLFLRGRKIKEAEQEAKSALRKAITAREKALQLKDTEAKGVAAQAIEIAEAALRQVKDDLVRIQGLYHICKKLRDLFGESISAEADAMLEEKYGFVEAPFWEKKLDGMIERLKKASLRPSEPVEIKIVNEGIGLAAATSTTVYFDIRYLRLRPSDDELMFVSGHELAHCQLDHSVLYVARDELNMQMQDLEGLERFNARDNRAYAAIRKGAWAAILGEYSREMELQADVLGDKLALSAGASPRGIKETLDRLAKMEQEGAKMKANQVSYPDPLKATHPKAKERLEWLEKAMGKEFWNEW